MIAFVLGFLHSLCFLVGLGIYIGFLAFCASAGWAKGRGRR